LYAPPIKIGAQNVFAKVNGRLMDEIEDDDEIRVFLGNIQLEID